MVEIYLIWVFNILFFNSSSFEDRKMFDIFYQQSNSPSGYEIVRAQEPVVIDGNWDKSVWEAANTFSLQYFLGDIPAFKPLVRAKLMYDEKNLYVIFKIFDRFVRCKEEKINGAVWEDSCVEFFFAPDNDFAMRYFNLEINCLGVPLMRYNRIPRKDTEKLKAADIRQIEIAHSIKDSFEGEITDTITWTVEYRLPLNILIKYSSNISQPREGVTWRANFYKIADKSSNPHYITWSPITNGKVDFHQPEFFNEIEFK